jgi:hypothetical protein
MKRLIAALLVVLVASPPAFAWGERGHFIVNEAATHGLPADMPHFFYRAFPELIWLSYEPDRWRNAGESLDAVNAPNHFLDYEYVAGLALPQDRYDYVDLLYTSGRLRKHGIGNAEPGFLPWTIAEEAQKLTVAFRNWRASQPGSSERAALERNIIHLAGVLGHYIGDGSQPYHTTMNYNGWVLPNPNRYAIDCGTHARFETQYVNHAVDVRQVLPKVAAPVMRNDFFATAIEYVKASNAHVETLYRLDRDGGFSPFGPIRRNAHAFTTDRLAAGASMLRDIWWSAWKKSGERPQRSGES